uniref:Chromosome 14 open reading frame 80 n=1 Tax=Nothobranchius korthausae TaxID=1143690 RepID=A0A1A8F7L2_9TELE
MKRTQAAVSVEVKRVIGALCRLLAALGLDSVPTPEAFRRAKFGGRTEEDQFWQLLSDILQTSGIVSCQTRTQLAADHRKLVAAGLWQTGYHADWMYRRDGGSFSCRDLLLALGWLLAAGALEKLVTCRVEQLDGSLLSPVPLKPKFSGDVEVDAASLRRLQWLIGRLRHQRRTLLSMIGVRTRLLHDVLSASGPSSGQSCAALQEDCSRLQQLCDLLEAFINWKRVENVFWTWTDSVVDLMAPPVPTSSLPPRGNPAVCCHGDGRLRNLSELLQNLPTPQEAERKQTGSNKEGSGPSPSPALLSLPFVPSIPEVCRVRREVEKPARRPGGALSRHEAPGELRASRAVELLLHAETLLLQRRDGRRRANRMLLQESIDCLEELVLIPR